MFDRWMSVEEIAGYQGVSKTRSTDGYPRDICRPIRPEKISMRQAIQRAGIEAPREERNERDRVC